MRYIREVSETAIAADSLGIDTSVEKDIISKETASLRSLTAAADILETAVNNAKAIDEYSEMSFAIRDNVIPAMSEVRKYADELETLTAKSCWPWPGYSELLFSC